MLLPRGGAARVLPGSGCGPPGAHSPRQGRHMPAPAPLPPAIPRPAFAVRDALRAGVAATRPLRGDLARSFRGVREVVASAPLRARCTSYLTTLRSGAYFRGPTAAALWGLPLPRSLESDARPPVGLPHRQRAKRLTGTVGHH